MEIGDGLEIRPFRARWSDKSEVTEVLTHPDSYRSCPLSRCTGKGKVSETGNPRVPGDKSLHV